MFYIDDDDLTYTLTKSAFRNFRQNTMYSDETDFHNIEDYIDADRPATSCQFYDDIGYLLKTYLFD